MRSRPWRPLADDQTALGDPVQQRTVAGRIGAVDPAREHGDGRPLGGECSSVRRGVDAERSARHHRPAALGELVAELGGDVLAVGGRGARSHDRHRAVDQLVEPIRTTHPQGERRDERDRPRGLVLGFLGLRRRGEDHGVHRPGRPLVVLGRDQPPAAPLGLTQVGQALVQLRTGPDEAEDAGRRPARPDVPRRRHGAVILDEPPEVDGARLGGPAQPRARPADAGMPRARRRGVLQVLVEVHAATRCSRMPRASATSSGPGTGRPAEVGQRPGHPEHAVEAPDRQRSALERPLRELQRRPRHRPSFPEQPTGHLAVRDESRAGQPGGRGLAGGPHPTSHRGRRLRLRGRVEPGGPGDRRQRDPEIDAVEQRPGHPGLVAAPFERTARAGGVAGGAGTGTRVGRQDQLRTARERRRTRRPVDGDGPSLEGLTEGVQHRARELRRLVEEQHAEVRPAQCPRPDLPRAAADQGRHGGRVVRRLERRPGDQRGTRRQRARDRVDGADLERGPLVQRREEAGQPLGQHGLAGPRRAGHQQVVPAGRGHLDRPPSGSLPDHVAEVGERRRRRQPATDVP